MLGQLAMLATFLNVLATSIGPDSVPNAIISTLSLQD